MKKSKVFLSPFGKEHLQKTFDWLQDNELRDRFKFIRQLKWEDHLKWFERLKSNDSARHYAIHCSDTGQHIGNCGLKHIDIVKKSCEMLIYIGETGNLRKGYGTAAAELLIHCAFEEFNLKLIYLYLSGDNIAAMRLYEKVGFKEEKKPPDNIWENSGLPDVRYMVRHLKNVQFCSSSRKAKILNAGIH